MALKEYEVTLGGVAHTMQLSDEDADRLGVKAVDVPNKQSTPANKAK